MQYIHNDQRDESAGTKVRKSISDAVSPFTCREWVALLQLRRRYRIGHDLWSAHELEHLRFLQWLYATGQVEV